MPNAASSRDKVRKGAADGRRRSAARDPLGGRPREEPGAPPRETASAPAKTGTAADAVAAAPTGRLHARAPGRSFSPLAGLLVFLLLGLPAACPSLAAEPASPAAPGAGDRPLVTGEEGAPPDLAIGGVVIRNENIFDLDDPRENNWLFRLANRLHIRTRPSVIAGQLLFRTGDPYDRRLLEESERILRSNRYLYDARVQPAAVADGRSDVEVRTRDVWTLRPGFSFSRKGGRNTTSVDVEELNFLGRGSAIRISRTSTVDRDSDSLSFSDGHLFGTWLQTDVLLSDTSDGRRVSLLLERPFYSLDTRWAAGVQAFDDERVDSLFQGGTAFSRFEIRTRYFSARGGWSAGLRSGWVRRWTFGVTGDEARFSPAPGETAPAPVPDDRVLAYPWVGFELIEDEFEKAKNRNQIERTEDFFLGTHVRVTLGHAIPAFGSDRHALPFTALLERGVEHGDRWILTLVAAADGRVEDGRPRDTLLSAALRQYLRLSGRWLFYASLSGSRAVRPDEDRQVLLGGENGLRGYPLRYQAGERRALFTLEQRYFTPWYPFRLFRVGGAIFFDMGRAWGGTVPEAPDPGVLRDVGFGLRIGNARSGLGNVIHLDVAFPLDGDPSIANVQFLVETKTSF